ncbi:MAG: hypothetical protein ABSG15_00840 [FCB group bacterium]|jgi:hypothetical protein
MEIKIFLSNINQEKIPENLKDYTKDCCQFWSEHAPWSDFEFQDYEKFKNKRNNFSVDFLARAPKLLIRPEINGGLAFDPDSAIVFWLDNEAYEIIQKLQNGTNLENIKNEFIDKKDELNRFLNEIKNFRIG